MSSQHVESRNHVLAFVALHHAEQKRKYTNLPYLSHLQAVAKMVDGKCDFGYEIALCHDLIEDTDCTPYELGEALERFGYSSFEVASIVGCVIELTDVYTHEKFSGLNRKQRKRSEALRLHNISPEAQTVKYCDIIDNSQSILEHDKGFARIYIPELQMVLDGMNKGDAELYKQALKSVNEQEVTI